MKEGCWDFLLVEKPLVVLVVGVNGNLGWLCIGRRAQELKYSPYP